LRERLYSNCLDYFCRERQLPTQEIDQLSEDITTLMSFWQVKIASYVTLQIKLQMLIMFIKILRTLISLISY